MTAKPLRKWVSGPWLALVSVGMLLHFATGCTPRYETVRRLSEPSALPVPIARSGSTVLRSDGDGQRLGRWRVRRQSLTLYSPDGVVVGRVLRRDDQWELVRRDGTAACTLRLVQEERATFRCDQGPSWTLSHQEDDTLRLEAEGGPSARFGKDAEGRWVARVGHSRSGVEPAILAQHEDGVGWRLRRTRPERVTVWRGRNLEPHALLAAECVLGPCASPGAPYLQEAAALVFLAARELTVSSAPMAAEQRPPMETVEEEFIPE